MKILFVNYWVGKTFSGGLAAMSAQMKKLGHEVACYLVDAAVTREEFKARIKAFDPRIVALSTYSFQWKNHREYAVWTKEVSEEILTLLGGYHPTFAPLEVIASPGVDIVCRGEGEGPVVELLDALMHGRDYRRISNLYVKTRTPLGCEKIFRNPYRNLIQDLDSLPDWDMELFDIDLLLEEPGCMTFVQLPHILPAWTGRGCPYRCRFCSNPGLVSMYKGTGPFVRKRSVARVLDEIKRRVEAHPSIRAVEFQDETFELSPGWLDEFIDRYPREIGLPFGIYVTGRRLDQNYVARLKKAGCIMVSIGVETGNEKFRMEVLNKPVSNADLEAAFEACREVHIATISLNMLGLPYETPDLAMETVAFNRKLKPTSFWYAVFQPFPGTPFHEICEEEGFVSGGSDYLYEGVENAIEQPSMSRERLKEIEKQFSSLRREIEELWRGEDPLAKAYDDWHARHGHRSTAKDGGDGA